MEEDVKKRDQSHTDSEKLDLHQENEKFLEDQKKG